MTNGLNDPFQAGAIGYFAKIVWRATRGDLMNLLVIRGAISEDVVYLMAKSRFEHLGKVGLACRQAQHRLS